MLTDSDKTQRYNILIDQISETGWGYINSMFPDDYLRELINKERELWNEGAFHRAKVGIGTHEQLRSEIRTDHVLWLNQDNLTPKQEIYWNEIDRLRKLLNEAFYIGLKKFEAHFAIYPPGSFYKKHLDQFKNVNERIISCILYLNEDWKSSFGGQLRIFTNADHEDEYIDIDPLQGTFVCFRSDQIYHEVLPANKERFSITGWLKKD
ncbi:MAG TPA: 2OG-Fe(II) oxygenase [Balneolales bacterium]|nr:2OG-Fe(II) oxygenase [Balneolales bacterium]